VLVEVNKDNKIERYFFKKKNGIAVLGKIQKIISHYNNELLNNDLIDLQLAAKENWYRDGKIIGL
jgi:outer membrane protein assembly factor BamD (BamD/ComL family)